MTNKTVASSSIDSTEAVISNYEKKIAQSIALKVLSNTTKSTPIVLTQEETLYMNKQIESEDIRVETPFPTITLKKGKTELIIPRAAEMVKRMEVLYPTTPKSDKKDTVIVEGDLEEGELENLLNELQESPIVADEPAVKPKSVPLQPPQLIKSVNQNAYEIRLDVLKESISFLTYATDCARSTIPPSSDDVIALASKFYKFVENKR